MQDAEEPEHEKDNQYQSQSAAEPSSTILAIPVIATPAAEQQDDQDNDQDCAHLPLLADSEQRPTNPSLELMRDLNAPFTE